MDHATQDSAPHTFNRSHLSQAVQLQDLLQDFQFNLGLLDQRDEQLAHYEGEMAQLATALAISEQARMELQTMLNVLATASSLQQQQQQQHVPSCDHRRVLCHDSERAMQMGSGMSHEGPSAAPYHTPPTAMQTPVAEQLPMATCSHHGSHATSTTACRPTEAPAQPAAGYTHTSPTPTIACCSTCMPHPGPLHPHLQPGQPPGCTQTGTQARHAALVPMPIPGPRHQCNLCSNVTVLTAAESSGQCESSPLPPPRCPHSTLPCKRLPHRTTSSAADVTPDQTTPSAATQEAIETPDVNSTPGPTTSSSAAQQAVALNQGPCSLGDATLNMRPVLDALAAQVLKHLSNAAAAALSQNHTPNLTTTHPQDPPLTAANTAINDPADNAALPGVTPSASASSCNHHTEITATTMQRPRTDTPAVHAEAQSAPSRTHPQQGQKTRHQQTDQDSRERSSANHDIMKDQRTPILDVANISADNSSNKNLGTCSSTPAPATNISQHGVATDIITDQAGLEEPSGNTPDGLLGSISQATNNQQSHQSFNLDVSPLPSPHTDLPPSPLSTTTSIWLNTINTKTIERAGFEPGDLHDGSVSNRTSCEVRDVSAGGMPTSLGKPSSPGGIRTQGHSQTDTEANELLWLRGALSEAQQQNAQLVSSLNMLRSEMEMLQGACLSAAPTDVMLLKAELAASDEQLSQAFQHVDVLQKQLRQGADAEEPELEYLRRMVRQMMGDNRALRRQAAAAQLEESKVSTTAQLEESKVSTTAQLEESKVSTTAQLEESKVSTTAQLQDGAQEDGNGSQPLITATQSLDESTLTSFAPPDPLPSSPTKRPRTAATQHSTHTDASLHEPGQPDHATYTPKQGSPDRRQQHADTPQGPDRAASDSTAAGGQPPAASTTAELLKALTAAKAESASLRVQLQRLMQVSSCLRSERDTLVEKLAAGRCSPGAGQVHPGSVWAGQLMAQTGLGPLYAVSLSTGPTLSASVTATSPHHQPPQAAHHYSPYSSSPPQSPATLPPQPIISHPAPSTAGPPFPQPAGSPHPSLPPPEHRVWFQTQPSAIFPPGSAVPAPYYSSSTGQPFGFSPPPPFQQVQAGQQQDARISPNAAGVQLPWNSLPQLYRSADPPQSAPQGAVPEMIISQCGTATSPSRQPSITPGVHPAPYAVSILPAYPVGLSPFPAAHPPPAEASPGRQSHDSTHCTPPSNPEGVSKGRMLSRADSPPRHVSPPSKASLRETNLQRIRLAALQRRNQQPVKAKIRNYNVRDDE